jgi:hypothetical protein
MPYESLLISHAATPPASAYAPTTPTSASYYDMFYNAFNYLNPGYLEQFLSTIDYYSLTQKVKDVVYNTGNVNRGFYVTLSGVIAVTTTGALSSNQKPINVILHYQ